MTAFPNSLESLDLAHLLHPYTNPRKLAATGPLVIERSEGVRVFDGNGKEYIEGFGGLWSVALGFSEPRLVKAATDQMRRLPFYHNFAYKSHPSAILLAERLASIAPGNLNHVFFANSGSEANDTVVKLIWFYNNARGRPKRKKIISRLRGYHGVTIASASLTGLPANHQDFDLPIPNILHTACPHYYRYARAGESESAFSARLAAELEEMILREGPDTVAAFIGEPVMAAGGVIVPPEGYWAEIQAVCAKYDVMLVADEVVTGFGRTGQLFGCNTYAIAPDFMVLSKQLTSSYQPLSAVLLSDEIYEVLAANIDRIGVFGHGFTCGGHPVATAVALENLAILEERGIVQHAAEMSLPFQAGLRKFANHPIVGEVRGVGLMAAVELVMNKAGRIAFPAALGVGQVLADRCQANGLIVRAIGDAVALSPPLVITPEEIDGLLARLSQALDETLGWIADNLR